METCPCGHAKAYEECCKPYHMSEAAAPTAETLMRSRYSAYVKCELDYLAQTLDPGKRALFDRRAAKDWSDSAEWKGLEILQARGGEADQQGQVDFIARFRQDEVDHVHHEISRFKKRDGKWYYVDGKVIPTLPEGAKVFQNDPCPCGSGKKYKRCCGAAAKI